MGICKCRKRTDLFCFVHKKAVCESCICTDHQVCVVKSYFDWLSEPDYEPPVCGVCKGELNADNMVRFLCLDMFHPECVDVYASSLPVNTALAGYTCPTCDKPMLPVPSNTSVLAQQIKKSFANSPWAVRVLGSPEEENVDLSSPPETTIHQEKHTTPSSPHISSSTPSAPPADYSLPSVTDLHVKAESNEPHPLDPLTYHPPPLSASATINIDQPSSNYGMTSHRKAGPRAVTTATGLTQYIDDEDEDKYRKKGFMQLLAALGLMSSGDSKRGVQIDPKKMTLIFAGLATLVILIFLYFVVFSEPDPITTQIE